MFRLKLRPPKINFKAKDGEFWRQTGMIVLGATVSLLLTIIAAKFLEDLQRRKDRRLTVLMVTHNIDTYWQTLDLVYQFTGHADSVAQWLLNHPVEDLERLPEAELQTLVQDALDLYTITYDNTTERIFSNSIETWRNMHNYRYIDIAGLCFSRMSSTAKRWNQWGDALEQLRKDVMSHPDQYPGENNPSKFLRNGEARLMLSEIHKHRCWLRHQSQILQYENKKAMAIMKVNEKELQKFDKKMSEDPVVDMEEPSLEYDIPPLNPNNLTTLRGLDERLEQVKTEM